MVTSGSTRQTQAIRLAEVVETSLSQETLSELPALIGAVVKAFDAFGGILWQVEPSGSRRIKLESRNLFVLSQWFPTEDRCHRSGLPVSKSLCGASLMKGRPLSSDDIWSDPRVCLKDPFLKAAGIRTMCSIPLSFSRNQKGVLNIHRQGGEFTRADIALAKTLSAIVPSLYHALINATSSRLMDQILAILKPVTSEELWEPDSLGRSVKQLEKVCRLLSRELGFMDCSIFGHSRTGDDHPELVATSWDGKNAPLARYVQIEGNPVRWVASTGKEILLLDITRPGQAKIDAKKGYSRELWKTAEYVISEIQFRQQAPPGGIALPISYCAVPILTDEGTVGVISCCGTLPETRFFSEWELNLLRRVASHVAISWTHWTSQHSRDKENRVWKSFQGFLTALDSEMAAMYSGTGADDLVRRLDEGHILDQSARKLAGVVNSDGVVAILQPDPEANALALSALHYSPSGLAQKEQLEEALAEGISLSDCPPDCAEIQAYKSGNDVIAENADEVQFYHGRLPGIRTVLAVPIRLGGATRAILAFYISDSLQNTPHMPIIARVAGQQIALYAGLWRAISALTTTQNVLDRQVSEEAVVLEDLEHQLKGPIIAAFTRVQLLLRRVAADVPDEEQLTRELQKIRGLLGKAKRVTRATGFFAALAQGRHVPLVGTIAWMDDLLKLLKEADMDNEVVLNPSRNIHFHINEVSFVDSRGNPRIDLSSFSLNQDLVDQAVNTLLDNAGKYSYPGTRVTTSCGTSKRGFYIVVASKGIRLAANEVDKCKERYWQSEEAKQARGGGKGIGLWIVDQIMKHHGGNLLAFPTDEDGTTEFHLVFPMDNGR